MSKKAFLAAAALLATGLAQATCYSVYKADGTLVHQTSTAPVNLSMPLGDTVPDKYGTGATMTVSDLSVYCKDVGGVPMKAVAVALKVKGSKAAEKVEVKQPEGEKAEAEKALDADKPVQGEKTVEAEKVETAEKAMDATVTQAGEGPAQVEVTPVR